MGWESAERVQKNEAGEYRALMGGQWVPVDSAQKNDAGEYRVMRQSAQEDATLPQKIAGSAPVRFAIGAAEPILGLAQMGANMLPNSTGIPDAVNGHLATLDQMIKRGRQGTSKEDPGFDAMRFGGQVLSPVNAGLAKVLPAAGTTIGRIGTGAAAGAAGGASSTVTDGGKDYWGQKGAQIGVGTLAGGMLTPVLGKVTDAIAPRLEQAINRFSSNRAQMAGARASMEADTVIEQALRDVGANADDLGAQARSEIRQQVVEALRNGQRLDAAALMRQRDFNAVGIQPTQGQLTRDATQFARERNLRGVPGLGEPLQQRFDAQNQRVQELVGNMRGNPQEAYPAGRTISDALQGVDRGMKANVDQAYGVARDHLGRAAPMDAPGFSRAANLALDEQMLGNYLPAEVRGILNDVSAGKIPFNVNTAVQIDSTLSAAQRAAGARTPQALAIGKVRDALNSAGIGDNVGQDAKAAFDTARGLARQRFAMHEAIPALEAAASGEAPDAFVQRFVLNGRVEETRRLADMLRENSPEAFQEARSQLGARISRAAFGENLTGDKLPAAERFARELRTIGADKMRAFFSQAEIDNMRTLARAVGYINTPPSSSAVNTSNNIGAITSLASRIPGIPAAVSIADALRNTVVNHSAANAAIRAQVPSTPAVSPEQAAALARLLTIGGAGAGVAGALSVR